jgi:hypothetical protein
VTFVGLGNVSQMTAVGAFTGGTAPAIAVTTTTSGSGGVAAKLPTAIDPYDHFLMIETMLAPPPSVCDAATVPGA